METAGEGSGEGPSGTQAREEPEVVEQWQNGADYDNVPSNTDTGRGLSADHVESFEENIIPTQGTESYDTDGDEVDGERQNTRSRKCSWAASKGANLLWGVLDAGLSAEEKKNVLHRLFSDERISGVDPELTSLVHKLGSVATTTVQNVRGALQTIRRGTIEGKSKVRNIVLTAAVSKGTGSQRNICNALGASRYLVRKAFQRRAEIDETGENLWAGGARKRRRDALSAEETSAVCSWWETETTVSPNKKDVKRRRTGVKEHETHATHYLQVSQVR